MSRVAKSPVSLPAGVQASVDAAGVKIKGKKGELSHRLHRAVSVIEDGGRLLVSTGEKSKTARAAAGTTRAILQNMVDGVSKGFEKRLEVVGVGYRAQVQGRALNLTLGYSHAVSVVIPEGITIETPSQTEIVVRGMDRRLVGQLAANIRSYRSPEPYKGKGVKYTNEIIIRKEAKKA
ncbi:MAG: 50S ribosomal protein L6 [Gammaproteobacteria bacterium]|nr:50S ribosomal protein L6 [Gammaproteobacteria bacterium]